MKTLVNTLRFGDPDWFPKFVPSLESWCQRHGHTLKAWTDIGVWEDYPCPKFCIRDMLEEFVQSECGRLVYVDADVWVHPEAPDFPHKYGLCVATDEHHLTHNNHFNGWCAALYGREFPLWEYCNAGVWSIDREAAEKMLRVWHPPYVEWFQDQHFFNAAACRAKEDHGMIVSRLPIEWNRWMGEKKPGWFQHAWAMEKEFDEGELLRLNP